ncbi:MULTISPECIES: GNAT family N-acetyltransferase [unclassified Erwinia]|uniref:GNAT family N-acetyltransferase n=1 Tax=unclassified Erwinia TaxID=2622719 RepID=UPI0006FD9289|nr:MULTISPECIES: GNAT family N-acetyltransferase [unclassified Erwinia]KQN64104.1 GCN5 family acetyltransferase [Erwinia sp. Leaf53]PLV57803.1 GCN5 family acetyltransferase [Erwinia sp. B116]
MGTYHFSLIDPERDRQASFTLMRELRPHLADADTFAAQIVRQAGQGYRLLGAWQSEQLMGLAGYRLQENLLYGRFLYVDDLVVAAEARSQGVGGRLIDALREEAKQQNCAHLVLDTALGNALAQRFYFHQGLLSKGLHFSQALQVP